MITVIFIVCVEIYWEQGLKILSIIFTYFYTENSKRNDSYLSNSAYFRWLFLKKTLCCVDRRGSANCLVLKVTQPIWKKRIAKPHHVTMPLSMSPQPWRLFCWPCHLPPAHGQPLLWKQTPNWRTLKWLPNQAAQCKPKSRLLTNLPPLCAIRLKPYR